MKLIVHYLLCQAYLAQEVYDSGLSLVKGTLSSTVLGKLCMVFTVFCKIQVMITFEWIPINDFLTLYKF